jgi:hypothetical protein
MRLPTVVALLCSCACLFGTLAGAVAQTGRAEPAAPAPSVSLDAPADGATVSGAVPVVASASGSAGISTVQLLVDGTVAGSDSTAPYTWAWVTTSVADGVHYLQARAYDNAGRLASSDTIAVTVANGAPPPPSSDGAVTGTYWADVSDYSTLESIGYGFAVTNVAPGNLSGAKAKLDAAHAAGIKLIIGLYSFGGPQPYTPNADGTWTFTQGSIDVIKYLATRQSDILAFFGFNEPYWTGPNGNNSCGYYSAAQLRQFRTQVQAIWPGAKIYQDIGWPSEWAPGGEFAKSYACIGNRYADQTGVADYVGIWAYPFSGSGYNPTSNLARFTEESNFVLASMAPAKPVWLGQSFGSGGESYPTDAQIRDWNCKMRAAMPAGAILSWYVWDNQYSDFLKNHPSQWPLTGAAACPP